MRVTCCVGSFMGRPVQNFLNFYFLNHDVTAFSCPGLSPLSNLAAHAGFTVPAISASVLIHLPYSSPPKKTSFGICNGMPLQATPPRWKKSLWEVMTLTTKTGVAKERLAEGRAELYAPGSFCRGAYIDPDISST
ncbi:hypothetical protein BJV77DRAFT_237117 [Russula vinacea]|nr:hypothetical protein BJV77DRAFT_237117 [Russula vinacea]